MITGVVRHYGFVSSYIIVSDIENLDLNLVFVLIIDRSAMESEFRTTALL